MFDQRSGVTCRNPGNPSREKAKTRRNIALVLFAIGGGSILLKIFGVLELDTSRAPSLSAAYGMELAYYVWPAIPLAIGYLFWASSKEKLLEAEYEEELAARQD